MEKCAVLMSVRPKWCELIAADKKTLEIRKSHPKLDCPFTVYVYQTQTPWVFGLLRNMGYGFSRLADRLCRGSGVVIGEFTCDSIDAVEVLPDGNIRNWMFLDLGRAMVGYGDMSSYIGKGKRGYAWHITDFRLYDESRSLSNFRRYSGFRESSALARPPQSWCYVEPLQEGIR